MASPLEHPESAPRSQPFGLPFWLLLLGFFLLALFGGQLRLGAQATGGESLLYSALVLRSEAAIGHLLIAVPIVLGVSIAAFRRGVLQAPTLAVYMGFVGLFLWFAFNVPTSITRYEAILDFARWVVAIAAAFGCCFVLGRDRGPRYAASALLAGIAAVAIIGLAEFASRGGASHRIFAGWHNPNALAGVLIIGVPLGLGLFAGSSERIERLLYGFATAATLCALWLTGSKGGLAAAAVGVVAYLILGIAKRGSMPSGWIKSTVLQVAFAALLVGVFAVGSLRAGGSAAGRFAEGATTEQSAGFRAQLWKDSLKAALEKPIAGTGAGSYSLTIRRHGETLGSELAHQTYLQTAVENGFLGLAVALVVIGAWLAAVLRRHPTEPPERSALRLAVVAGVLAIGANGLVESNLSYFGIRVALFALLGIGLNLSVDGLMPERVPVWARACVATGLALGAGYTFLAAAISDSKVAEALDAMSTGNVTLAEESLATASGFAPADPQPLYQRARLAAATRDWETALLHAKTVAERTPDPTYLALYARAQAATGKVDEAAETMDRAIAADPNDPHWRAEKSDLLRQAGRYEDAEVAARDAIEADLQLREKPNALPWHVSTDTLLVRRWLLSRADSNEERLALLQGIFDLLASYMEKTAVEISSMTGYREIAEARSRLSAVGGDEEMAEMLGFASVEDYRAYKQLVETFEIAGESVVIARQKHDYLREVAAELEAAYRSAGDEAGAAAVRDRLEAIDRVAVVR